MKTLGEILTAARISKGLSQEDIVLHTKIEPKYIKALEENDYPHLPPTTFTKGFIRNYAKALGKNPDDLVAVYRRDSKTDSQSPPPGSNSDFSIKKTLLNAPKSTIALITFGTIIFFGYLAFQYRALIVPPPLIITQPTDGAVHTSPLTIEGKTSSDSLVVLNDDTNLKPDQSGIFVTQLNYSPGEYQLIIKATNRFSRTATKTLNISIISQ